MADKDGSVRDTAAHVAGDLAQNYLEVKGQPLPSAHPILQIAQDTIISQGRDLSTAGGTALSKMASYLAPLEPDTIKHMLRLLSTDNFMSKQYMLQTFAAWDEDKQRGSGLIIRGRESVLQHIGALIGSQKTASKHGMICTSSQQLRWCHVPAADGCAQRALLGQSGSSFRGLLSITRGCRVCRAWMPGVPQQPGLARAQARS